MEIHFENIQHIQNDIHAFNVQQMNDLLFQLYDNLYNIILYYLIKFITLKLKVFYNLYETSLER